jgi:hypothetical protein
MERLSAEMMLDTGTVEFSRWCSNGHYKEKVEFTLEQAMKAQRRSRVIALLFL